MISIYQFNWLILMDLSQQFKLDQWIILSVSLGIDFESSLNAHLT